MVSSAATRTIRSTTGRSNINNMMASKFLCFVWLRLCYLLALNYVLVLPLNAYGRILADSLGKIHFHIQLQEMQTSKFTWLQPTVGTLTLNHSDRYSFMFSLSQKVSGLRSSSYSFILPQLMLKLSGLRLLFEHPPRAIWASNKWRLLVGEDYQVQLLLIFESRIDLLVTFSSFIWL